MGGAGTHVDQVGAGQGNLAGRRPHDGDVGQVGEIPAGAGCQIGLDLVCNHIAAGTDELGQHGAVVTGSGTDVDNRLTLARRAGSQAARMQARLSVVDAPVRGKTDQDVLVEQSWIRADGGQVARNVADRPWASTDVMFALDAGESGDQTLIR